MKRSALVLFSLRNIILFAPSVLEKYLPQTLFTDSSYKGSGALARVKKAPLVMLLTLMLFFAFTETLSSYGSATNPIVEIISVEVGKTTFSTWNSTFYFYKNEVLSVKATVRNNDNVSRTATIYLNAIDELDQPFGIYIGNVTLLANETMVIYGPIYIPMWAFSGYSRVTAIAKTLPENTYCLEKTSNFYLSVGAASYLKLQTSAPEEGGFNVTASVDGNSGLAPATVQVDPGLHALTVQTITYGWVSGVLYKYAFSYWEDGLTSASRTINAPMSMNQTMTAYYSSEPYPVQPSRRAGR